MKLTLEQLRPITFGAVRIWQEEDGIRFRRCTKLQEQGWKAMRDTFHDRCTATSGIRLDFHTDSAFFALEIGNEAKMEVLVDGITAMHLEKTSSRPLLCEDLSLCLRASTA